MDKESNSSGGGGFGSPISGLSGSGSVLDNDKIQKVVNNYQKIKTQNAILKKALVQEQQKTNDLEKTVKEKEQALVTALQEHDVLDFNNQRLTKRITLMQEEFMNSGKKESGGQWFGRNTKIELQKKEDEINVLRSELQEKIEDNEGLHSVNIEKENAYKALESDLKSCISNKDIEIKEKEEKIETLLLEQKESEKKLQDQTKGLRDAISLLENNFKQIYSSTRQRDDVLIQLGDIIQRGLNSNSPNITLDYPLENITPSNERFSFDEIQLDKNFKEISNVIDTNAIKSITDRNSWVPLTKQIMNSAQTFLSYHLEQISNLIGSHRRTMNDLIESNQNEFLKINENMNRLTLQKEELEFRVNTLQEQLLAKEREITELNQKIQDTNNIVLATQESKQQIEQQAQKDKEAYEANRKQLEQQIKTLKSDFERETKQAKDQHQGLLKHQKTLLNSKITEKDAQISNLEKKINLLLKQTNINSSNNTSPITSNNNTPTLLPSNISPSNSTSNLEELNSTDNSATGNNDVNSNNLLDLSFLENSSNSNNNNNSSPNISNGNNNSTNNLIDLDDDTINSIENTIQETNIENNSGTPKILSERFKLSVLDETGDESDSLNFSLTDKERENEMKIYYENKITQLLNKISNIDAKAIRYYDQYQILLKKGGASQQELDSTVEQLKNAKDELKNTKDELEVTRVNYDQQMRYLTEQFISLNENVSSLDGQINKIKQHKVSCGKCKAWNSLDYIFSPNNQGLYCSKGHPILSIQP
ncbi:hypothetical protein DICPUDRAFT_157996 [Dictyostelium purpureum]|uniref:Protein phosphatase 1 regulatory subunit 21 N-terminal domain-containing protein n=1 Tax=Dictyostelium purpureum TaxID=5786 RepID=F1A0J6_DICPU|nr:uncharacterized protein DICPUDRAFT_157996 [Dictyostelium purpureum]EGC30288.1 hypothetical protein DICPUDRAFT_157996 [Dictyostelium purpureum]|eukprot:XP_003293191.1 hypothetical protein DICPUDRAFT_157996 [Dictyostelium purpureum]